MGRWLHRPWRRSSGKRIAVSDPGLSLAWCVPPGAKSAGAKTGEGHTPSNHAECGRRWPRSDCPAKVPNASSCAPQTMKGPASRRNDGVCIGIDVPGRQRRASRRRGPAQSLNVFGASQLRRSLRVLALSFSSGTRRPFENRSAAHPCRCGGRSFAVALDDMVWGWHREADLPRGAIPRARRRSIPRCPMHGLSPTAPELSNIAN
jgi:hypothetical protein